MNRGTRIVFTVATLAALGGFGIYVTRNKPTGGAAGAAAPSASAERVVPVTTSPVEKRDVPVILEGLGTVTPLMSVMVRSQVDGRLDSVAFTEGKAVKKGELLAQIDPRPYTIQLHQGEAALVRDKANLSNGQLNERRYTELRQGNLIPQQQLDDQKATVASYDAAVRTDQAQIEAARLNLDYARITSPIDGVTGVRLVDPGNIVHQADATGIVLVTQLDPITVVFTLPQDVLPRLQAAMAAGKPVVEIYARDANTQMAKGELVVIDNQVNAQTATVRLKATMANPDKLLWPNQFVKARVHLETKKDSLVVPASAVQRGPKGAFVYVVGPDQTVQAKPVEVASVEGEIALLSKGLNPGDVAVTDGQNQLRQGAKVAPRGPKPEGSGAPAHKKP